MKKINHIKSKKFVTYVRMNLVVMIAMKLHLKNTMKLEIIAILLVNLDMLLLMFVI